jgi:chloramphenicol-sensitive protein RarD
MLYSFGKAVANRRPVPGNIMSASEPASSRGFVLALSAYLLWGILPLYMKALSHIPAVEVLAHRIIWSVPVAAIVLYALGRTGDFRAAIRSPKMVATAILPALLITFNWGLYVWAIINGHAVETALGYYINPLVTVALGAALLGERLSPLQLAAVGIALAAVLLLTVEQGKLPWISLSLALSFALYGYLRKTLPLGPSQGMLLEVLLLLPVALAYLGWLSWRGENHFDSMENALLLMFAGPATALPLIIYAAGARALPISTLGMLQYVSPTLVGLIAIFVFHESFDRAQAIAFGLIVIALAFYSWSILSRRRRALPTTGR